MPLTHVFLNIIDEFWQIFNKHSVNFQSINVK